MFLLDQIAERRINEAIERGELDNLPGAGRPLELDDDRHVPPELRVAYRVLKNAGFLPPELELRREIACVEDLLVAAEDAGERSRAGKRLEYLLRRLGLARGKHEDLRLQHAYYDRLRERLRRKR